MSFKSIKQHIRTVKARQSTNPHDKDRSISAEWEHADQVNLSANPFTNLYSELRHETLISRDYFPRKYLGTPTCPSLTPDCIWRPLGRPGSGPGRVGGQLWLLFRSRFLLDFYPAVSLLVNSTRRN